MSNRAELRALASNFCEDPSLTKFTTAKYNDALDSAQKQFCLDTKVLYKTLAYVMALDDASYALPADFILDKIVMLNGIELDPISKQSLSNLYKGSRWDTLTGTPSHYIVDPMEANKNLLLFPIPDSISSGTDLQLTYFCLPGTMSSDSDLPFNSSSIMAQYHIAVAQYAAWMLLGYLTPTDPIISKRRELISSYAAKTTNAIQEFGDTKSEPISFHPRDVRVR